MAARSIIAGSRRILCLLAAAAKTGLIEESEYTSYNNRLDVIDMTRAVFLAGTGEDSQPTDILFDYSAEANLPKKRYTVNNLCPPLLQRRL